MADDMEEKVESGKPKAESRAMVGFILGLVSIIAWFIPLFGYPVTIVGLIFSSMGLKAEKNRTKAIAGLVLCIVFLVVTLINSIAGAMMMSSLY